MCSIELIFQIKICLILVAVANKHSGSPVHCTPLFPHSRDGIKADSFLVTEAQDLQEDSVSSQRTTFSDLFTTEFVSVVNLRPMRYKHNCFMGFLSEQFRKYLPLCFKSLCLGFPVVSS